MNSRRNQLAQAKAKHLEWIWEGHCLKDDDIPEATGKSSEHDKAKDLVTIDTRSDHDSEHQTHCEGMVACENANQQSPGFVGWLQSQQSLFWISGKPASGKSTLMEYVSKHGLCSKFLEEVTGNKWLLIHFFFDFRAHKGMANSTAGMMRSLLCQLVSRSDSISRYIAGTSFARHIDVELDDTSYDTLQSIIASSIIDAGSQICIFLDGLDEFEGNPTHLIQCIFVLADVRGIKICLASRPEPMLQHAFRDVPKIFMQEYNRQTIQAYATESLSEYAGYLSAPHLLRQLAEEILRQSEGVILWSQFACSDVTHGLLAHETFEELISRIASYPDDLDEVYERLIEKTDRRFQPEIVTVLYLRDKSHGEWMDLGNLSVILSWLRGQGFVSSYPRQLLSTHDFESRLLARLGGLIDIYSEAFGNWKSVRLIHKTLGTFLTKSNSFINCLPPPFQSSYPDNVWLRLCCDIMTKNRLFATQSIQQLIDHMTNTDLDLFQYDPEKEENFIEAYKTLGLHFGIPSEDSCIDCKAFLLAFNEFYDIHGYGWEFDHDTTLVRKCHRVLMSGAFCLHKFWIGFHRYCQCCQGSPEEWLAVARLDANERALLFSIQHTFLPLVRESISQMCSPGSWVVNKCLVLLPELWPYSHRGWTRQEVREVQDWLLKHVPADEAHRWVASRYPAPDSEDDYADSGDDDGYANDNGEDDDNDNDDEENNNNEDRDEDGDDGGVKLG